MPDGNKIRSLSRRADWHRSKLKYKSQNQNIVRQFTEIVRKIESLYKSDAARQVEAAQSNVLADYGGLYQLRRENKTLSDTNEKLESELNTLHI